METVNPRELVADLRLRPVEGKRCRNAPPGVLVLNETWSAAAVRCEPGCGWFQTHRTIVSDISITARNHAEINGHQTLMAWYAADRYVPDPVRPPTTSPRPGMAPPSDSDPRGRLVAHPDLANSRKANTTETSTK